MERIIPSNIGINAAQGKYIGFVDSDDWVVNDAFEKLVTEAEKFNAELVIGDFNTLMKIIVSLALHMIKADGLIFH